MLSHTASIYEPENIQNHQNYNLACLKSRKLPHSLLSSQHQRRLCLCGAKVEFNSYFLILVLIDFVILEIHFLI